VLIKSVVFAIFFFSWSASLSSDLHSVQEIHTSLVKVLAALSTYTPAKVGDCTIMDTLEPFCKAAPQSKVQAACDGAESTRTMTAKLGRSAYVPKEEQGNIPDPGAVGVAAIIKGFYEGFYSRL
jgi:triose/dihydroxyacetone kinase / FAD-AMP lyase (cyclizing)